MRIFCMTVHETTYDIWDMVERCTHSNREDVRARAAGMLSGAVKHLTSTNLAVTKRKATQSALGALSPTQPDQEEGAGAAGSRRGRGVPAPPPRRARAGGLPAMPSFAEEGEGEGEGEGEDASEGEQGEEEDIVPPLLSELHQGMDSAPASRRSSLPGASADDLPEVIRVEFLQQAATLYMTLLNDMDPMVQMAALSPPVISNVVGLLILMRGQGDAGGLDTLAFVPEDDPPEYDDGYPPYIERDEEDLEPDEDEDALATSLAWVAALPAVVEAEKASMLEAPAELGGGQSFTAVFVDEDALSDFEDAWEGGDGAGGIQFCDGLEEGADPALDEYFGDAMCDVDRDNRGEVALARALRRLGAEESPMVRASVAKALPEVAHALPDAIRRTTLRHLLVRLACDEHSDVRVAAAAATGRMITAFAVEAAIPQGGGLGPLCASMSPLSPTLNPAALTFADANNDTGVPLTLLAAFALSARGLHCTKQRIAAVVSASLAFTRLSARHAALHPEESAMSPQGGAASSSGSSTDSDSDSDSDSEGDSAASHSSSGSLQDGFDLEELDAEADSPRGRSRSYTLRGRNREEAESEAAKNADLRAAAKSSGGGKGASASAPADDGEGEGDYGLWTTHDKLQTAVAHTLPALVLTLGVPAWHDILRRTLPGPTPRVPAAVREAAAAAQWPASVPCTTPLSLHFLSTAVAQQEEPCLAVTSTVLAGAHEAARELRHCPPALAVFEGVLRQALGPERFRWPTLQQRALDALPRVLQWTTHQDHVSLTSSLYQMVQPAQCQVWRTRWKLASLLPTLTLIMSPRALALRLLPLCNILLRDPVSIVRRDAARATAVLLCRLQAVGQAAQAVLDHAAQAHEKSGAEAAAAEGASPARSTRSVLRFAGSPSPLKLAPLAPSDIPPRLLAQCRDLQGVMAAAVSRTGAQLCSLATPEAHLDCKSAFVKLGQFLCFPRVLRNTVVHAMEALSQERGTLPPTMMLVSAPSAAGQGQRHFPGSPDGGEVVPGPPSVLLSPSVQTSTATPAPPPATPTTGGLTVDQQFALEWEGLALSLGIPCPALQLSGTHSPECAVSNTLAAAAHFEEPACGGISATPPPAGLAPPRQSPALGGLASPSTSAVQREATAGGIACITRAESSLWRRQGIIAQAVGSVSRSVFQEHFQTALVRLLSSGRVQRGGYLWRQAVELLPPDVATTVDQAAAQAEAEADASDSDSTATMDGSSSCASEGEGSSPSQAPSHTRSGTAPDLASAQGSLTEDLPPARPRPVSARIAVPVVPAVVSPAGTTAAVLGSIKDSGSERIAHSGSIPMHTPSIKAPSPQVIPPPTVGSGGLARSASTPVDGLGGFTLSRSASTPDRRHGGAKRTSTNSVVSLVSPRGRRHRTSATPSATAGHSGAELLTAAREGLRSTGRVITSSSSQVVDKLQAAAARAKGRVAASKGAQRSMDVMTSLTFDPGAWADDEAAMDFMVNKVIAQQEEAEAEEEAASPSTPPAADEASTVERPRPHRRSASIGSAPTRRQRASVGASVPSPEKARALWRQRDRQSSSDSLPLPPPSAAHVSSSLRKPTPAAPLPEEGPVEPGEDSLAPLPSARKPVSSAGVLDSPTRRKSRRATAMGMEGAVASARAEAAQSRKPPAPKPKAPKPTAKKGLAHFKYLAMLKASGADSEKEPPPPPRRDSAPKPPAKPAGAAAGHSTPQDEAVATGGAPAGAGAASCAEEHGEGAGDGGASGESRPRRHSKTATGKQKRRSLGALGFMKANRASLVPSPAPETRPFSDSIPYAELSVAKAGSSSLNLDWSRKEQYLSDTEFSRVLGVSREEFEELPRWRQQRIKRDVSLF